MIPKYHRDAFSHWSSVDRICGLSDSRQLCIYLNSLTIAGIKQAKVNDKGRVYNFGITCMYTGQLLDTQEMLHVDHVVPLKAAWERGAYLWNDEKLKKFANDQKNLLPVLSKSNMEKSSDGLFNWIPSNLHNGIKYLGIMKMVASEYNLQILPKDEAAFRFLINKLERHQNGIKLDKVRDWFAIQFGWTY